MTARGRQTWGALTIFGVALLFASCGSTPGEEPAAPPPERAAPAKPAADATAKPSNLLIAWIDEDESAGYAPHTVTFIAEIKGGVPPYTIKWNFDDGSKPGTEATEVHTYDKPGRYLAELFVSDTRGEKDDDFTIIEAWEE